MKLFIALMLLTFSWAAQAQTIEFKLAGANEKKWVGQHIYSDDAHSNPSVFIFEKSHRYRTSDVKTHRGVNFPTWSIEKGLYLNDNIILRIGKKLHQVEFLSSSNGKDLMQLSNVPKDEDEEIEVRTYIAE